MRGGISLRDIDEHYGMGDIYDIYEMLLVSAYNDMIMNGDGAPESGLSAMPVTHKDESLAGLSDSDFLAAGMKLVKDNIENGNDY